MIDYGKKILSSNRLMKFFIRYQLILECENKKYFTTKGRSSYMDKALARILSL